MGQIIHTPYWSIVTLQLPWIVSDESGEVLFFCLLVFNQWKYGVVVEQGGGWCSSGWVVRLPAGRYCV